MSGVRYHQKTDEEWCNRSNPELGTSYKEYLSQIENLNEKINFEMTHKAKESLNEIYQDLKRPMRKLQYIKLELIQNQTKQASQEISKHLHLKEKLFYRLLKEQLEYKSKSKHVTNKSNNLYTYLDSFNKVNYDKFLETYPEDILTRMGYGERCDVGLYEKIDAANPAS